MVEQFDAPTPATTEKPAAALQEARLAPLKDRQVENKNGPGVSSEKDANAPLVAAGVIPQIDFTDASAQAHRQLDLQLQSPAVHRKTGDQQPAAEAQKVEQTQGSDRGTVRVNKDGSRVVETKDGASIFIDSNNRVTNVAYANGDWRTFTYDSGGNLTSVRENNQFYRIVDGELVGMDGKPTGRKHPLISSDGVYTYTDKQGSTVSVFPDRIEKTTREDRSTVTKDSNGRVAEIKYPDGRTSSFGYDASGRINSFTDVDGKRYDYDPSVVAIKPGDRSLRAKDGSIVTNIVIQQDGTVQYTNTDLTVSTDYTSGNSSKTRFSGIEIEISAWVLRPGNAANKDNAGVKNTLAGMTSAERVALDAEYNKQHGRTLKEQLEIDRKDPNKRANAEAALRMLSEAHLREAANKAFSDKEQLAEAHRLIDEYQERSQKDGSTHDQIVKTLDKAARELGEPAANAAERQRRLEETLRPATSVDELSTRYGVKSELFDRGDGTTVRKFYVEGENGTKLPVLETMGDNPREIERKLQEWRDLKMKEIEQRYNVKFSRDGQTEVNRDGKTFDLRSPKINELLALEEGLRRSQPSTNTLNPHPVLVQFAVQISSARDVDAYYTGNKQRRIVFEPKVPDREFQRMKEATIHEWAHNSQYNMRVRNPAALDKVYADMGWRRVVDGGSERFQLRGSDGHYYMQRPDSKDADSNWVRVDANGKPLKPDGKPAANWDDKGLVWLTNAQMADKAAVKPASFGFYSPYFPHPDEMNAEALTKLRGSLDAREDLYLTDVNLYRATKEYDQKEIDADPSFGTNKDGSSKFIRHPDGRIVANSFANQRAVREFEAELERKRQQKPQRKADATETSPRFHTQSCACAAA